MNKVYCFSIIVFIISISNSFAQDINYDQIILPENAIDISIEERLVQLAWKNNPINNIQQSNIEYARRNIKLAEASWLDNIRITGNINEFVINPSSDEFNRAQFFPLYNVSASIPLGIFISNPQRVKLSRIQHDIEQQNLNQQKLQIRARVLRNYENYLLNRELLAIQTEITENVYNTFALIEDKFKNGETTIEDYNQAFKNYKQARRL